MCDFVLFFKLFKNCFGIGIKKLLICEIFMNSGINGENIDVRCSYLFSV